MRWMREPSIVRHIMRAYTLIAIGLGLCSAANATVIPIEFTGVVTIVKDTNNVLQGTVQAGMAFNGTFALDTSTSDIYPNDPKVAWYAGAVTSMSSSIGPYTIDGPGGANRVIVSDYSTGMDYLAIVAGPRQFRGLSVMVDALLIDTDASLFTSDAMPLVVPSLSEFEDATVALSNSSGSLGILATVTSLSSPEPTTVVLLAVISLVALNRRHQRW
jgi:hypothetical protein